MHPKSWVVATALAFAAIAVAEPVAERPRIYYPRNPNRQFGNETIDTASSELDPVTSTTSRARTTSSTESVIVPTTRRSSTRARVSSSRSFIRVSSSTRIQRSTSRVVFSSESSESSLIIAPTGVVSSSSTSAEEESTTSSSTPIISSSRSRTTTNADSSSSSVSEASQSSASPKSSASKSSSSSDSVTVASSISRSSAISSSTSGPATSGPATSSAASTSREPPSTVSPSSRPSSSSTTSFKSETVVESSSSSISRESSTSLRSTASPEPTSVETSRSVSASSDFSSSKTTNTAESSATSSDSTITILPSLSSTDSSRSFSTQPSSVSTSSESSIIIIPTVSSSFTGTGTVLSSTQESSITVVPTPSTIIGTGSSSQTIVPSISSEPISLSSQTFTQSPLSTPSPIASSEPIVPVVNSTTPVATELSPGPVSPSTVSSEAPTSVPPVTSIRPTATVSNTDNVFPSTIVAESSSIAFSTPSETSATTTSAEPLPTDIPKVIRPSAPAETTPEGTVPLQIGFQYPLNYLFVAGNPVAAAQIFRYLPQALADAGGFSQDKAPVSRLVPLDTREKLGFVTTKAIFNYPSTMVESLQISLLTANSPLYNNKDPLVRNLTALINTNIDIRGNINDGETTPGSPNPTNGPGSNNDAFEFSDKEQQTSKQKATTAGIAVGAVSFSVIYGAAMFVVARRYKRKRQAHRRASSIYSKGSSEVRYTGAGSPAFMGGALLSREFFGYGGVAGGRDSHGSGRSGMGNSVRTAHISAPVAAENSLGWY